MRRLLFGSWAILFSVSLATSTGAQGFPTDRDLDLWQRAFPEGTETLSGQTSWRLAATGEPVSHTARADLEARLRNADPTDPGRSHALGFFRLLTGETTKAVEDLETAAAGAGSADRWAVWNDLAVAHLERLGNEPPIPALVWIDALEAADRAVEELPSTATPADGFPPRFNRALALRGMRLWLAAEAELQALTADAPTTADRAAVTAELEALGTTSNAWKETRERIVRAAAEGDRRTVDRLVATAPLRARNSVVLELLPAWGRTANPDPAAAADHLRTARAVAAALGPRGTGTDDLLAEAVEQLAENAVQDPRWSEAFGLFAAALDRDDTERNRAVEDFERAGLLFRELGSPFEHVADFRRALSYFYGQEREAAVRILRAGWREIGPEKSHILHSKIGRMLALADLELATPGSALERLQELDDLQRSRPEAERPIGPDSLMGSTHNLLHQPEEAWRWWHIALRAQSSQAGPRIATLEEAASASHAQGRLRLSWWLAEELRRLGEWTSRDRVTLEGHRGRGRARFGLGDLEAGRAELDLARKWVEEHEEAYRDNGQEAEHDLLLAEVAVDTGRSLASSDPETAVASLRDALRLYRKLDRSTQIPVLRGHLGRAYREQGDEAQAAEELRAVLRLSEEGREALPTPNLRRTYYDAVQDVVGDILDLVEGPEETLLLSEQARAKNLLDHYRHEGGSPPFESWAEIAARLPAGVVLVEFAWSARRLLIWTGRRNGELRRYEVDDTARLREDLREFARRSASGDDGQETERLARSLHGRLLGPVAADLDTGEVLVLVPDGPLFGIPFDALVDPQTGRPLVRDHGVVIAASAALFLEQSARLEGFDPKGRRSALAVGAPDIDPRTHPGLSPLPGAGEEAREIAALYPERLPPLVGGDATRNGLLQALPQADVVHLAAHVLPRPNAPEQSPLLLTPSGEDPDGLFDAGDVTAEAWSGVEVVVLSGCESLSRFPRGREGPAGLAYPFLSAGVPVVVASLWPVSDRATREVMTRFHRRLARGESPARAFRQVQEELLADDDAELSSPAVWAAFKVIGGLRAPP